MTLEWQVASWSKSFTVILTSVIPKGDKNKNEHKMAAKVTSGEICSGPMSRFDCNMILYFCFL